MRTGVHTVHQTLTCEAASVLKHSLSLARRRGHSQVTPLHVATTLLSSRASLDLKRACLKSQLTPQNQNPNSSLLLPLHCRALELCFNVALNRLPTTPSPLLHSQQQPSLSNALIAALKRAQAHQRRGCIENQQQNQQQPLLAIKVELEQLILSILDDPSVSRVMREAGFSSTAVKSNLEEDSVFYNSSVFGGGGGGGGVGVFSSPSSPEIYAHRESFWKTHFLNCNPEPNPALFFPQKSTDLANFAVKEEDIKLVLEVLVGKKQRRNTVIVGESVGMNKALVAELMKRVERGDVPGELRSVHFIEFQFTSVPLRFMKREEVEQNISDLKRKVDSLTSGGGGERVIVYAGDLKWTVEAREVCGYNPVDHLVAEIGRLFNSDEYSNNLSTRVWLMGSANYETYIKCQMRKPSLEIQWSLQAVSVPSGGLGLSLHATSGNEPRINLSQIPSTQLLETKPFGSGKEEQEKHNCCSDCSSKFEAEAGLLIKSCNTKEEMDKGSTQLPHWLQSQDSKQHHKDDLVELRRKWNIICHSQHQFRNHTSSFPLNNQISNERNSHTYASTYPWWPTNPVSKFQDSNSISFAHSTTKPNLPRFRRQQSCHIEFSFSKNMNSPNLDSLKNTEGKEVKITLALGNSHDFPNTEKVVEKRSEICKKLLQENVPWQLETIPSIVEALIEKKEKTKWILIEGNDWIGKRRLARAIGESVLGSADLILQMNMREEREGKMSFSYGETLKRALRYREKLVVLVENIDFADTQFSKFLADGFETGKFGESSGNEGNHVCEAIFILTKGDSSESYGNGKENVNPVIQMKLEVSGKLPNSDNKRKAEWDLPNKAKKSPRIDEKENLCSIGNHQENEKTKTLDLNMEAIDDEEEGGDFSPVLSDLTCENGSDLKTPHGFLELIKNKYTFSRDSIRDSRMREMVLSRMRGCFEEVRESEGGLNCCLFEVEEGLVEEVLVGFGSFLNSLFEKWLKEVLKNSLQTVKLGGKEEGGRGVRLCLGEGNGENGFMGSSLPKKIQVSFMG